MTKLPPIAYINVNDPAPDLPNPESPEQTRLLKSVVCISYQEGDNTILESADGSRITLDRKTAKELGEWLINTAFKDLGSGLFAYFLTSSTSEDLKSRFPACFSAGQTIKQEGGVV